MPKSLKLWLLQCHCSNMFKIQAPDSCLQGCFNAPHLSVPVPVSALLTALHSATYAGPVVLLVLPFHWTFCLCSAGHFALSILPQPTDLPYLLPPIADELHAIWILVALKAAIHARSSFQSHACASVQIAQVLAQIMNGFLARLRSLPKHCENAAS